MNFFQSCKIGNLNVDGWVGRWIILRTCWAVCLSVISCFKDKSISVFCWDFIISFLYPPLLLPSMHYKNTRKEVAFADFYLTPHLFQASWYSSTSFSPHKLALPQTIRPSQSFIFLLCLTFQFQIPIIMLSALWPCLHPTLFLAAIAFALPKLPSFLCETLLSPF